MSNISALFFELLVVLTVVTVAFLIIDSRSLQPHGVKATLGTCLCGGLGVLAVVVVQTIIAILGASIG